MLDIEFRVRGALAALKDVPKTDKEKLILEALLVQIQSHDQLGKRINSQYQKLRDLIEVIERGDPLNILVWCERYKGELKLNHIATAIEYLKDIPTEITNMAEKLSSHIGTEIPVPGLEDDSMLVETLAYIHGAIKGRMNHEEIMMFATMKALKQIKQGQV